MFVYEYTVIWGRKWYAIVFACVWNIAILANISGGKVYVDMLGGTAPMHDMPKTHLNNPRGYWLQ